MSNTSVKNQLRSWMIMSAAMGASFAGFDDDSRNASAGLNVEGIKAEYEKIQRKESALSRSQRDTVVRQYNILAQRGLI